MSTYHVNGLSWLDQLLLKDMLHRCTSSSNFDISGTYSELKIVIPEH